MFCGNRKHDLLLRGKLLLEGITKFCVLFLLFPGKEQQNFRLGIYIASCMGWCVLAGLLELCLQKENIPMFRFLRIRTGTAGLLVYTAVFWFFFFQGAVFGYFLIAAVRPDLRKLILLPGLLVTVLHSVFCLRHSFRILCRANGKNVETHTAIRILRGTVAVLFLATSSGFGGSVPAAGFYLAYNCQILLTAFLAADLSYFFRMVRRRNVWNDTGFSVISAKDGKKGLQVLKFVCYTNTLY